MKIHLYNYKNYYNRYADKLNTIEAYSPYLLQTLYDVYNFDYGDGVNTSHTVNYLDTLEVKPNYLIVERDDGRFSRWYVIDGNHLKDDREVVVLHRDVVADFWTYIRTAECFVQKAIMNASGSGSTTGFDPLIFNNEKLVLNQIKKAEVPIIKDYNYPWIIGFMDTKAKDNTISYIADDGKPIYQFETFEEFPYYDYVTDDERDGGSLFGGGKQLIKYLYSPVYTIAATPRNTSGTNWSGYHLEIKIWDINHTTGMSNPRYSASVVQGSVSSGIVFEASYLPLNDVHALDSTATGRILNFVKQLTQTFPQIHSNWKGLLEVSHEKDSEIISELLNYARGHVMIGGTTYKLQVRTPVNVKTFAATIKDLSANGPLEAGLLSAIQNYTTTSGGTEIFHIANYSDIQSGFRVKGYREASIATLTADSTAYYSYSIGDTTRPLDDAPYKMFAMPLGNLDIGGATMTKWLSLRIARDISDKHSGTDLYDMQIVPYCPKNFESLIDGWDYTIVRHGTTVAGAIYWCDTCEGHFTFTIPRSPLDTDNLKVCNEAEFYRLCAPDYSSVYEYSLAKNLYNYGLDVYYYYKPYASTVAVIPQYAGEMYTGSFKGTDGTRADARGLICTGGFTMTQSGNAFAQYERQNVNYMRAFNREIESIDLNNKVQGELDKVNAIVGTISGIGAGASFGSTLGSAVGGHTGGIAGSIAGGLIGGVASGIAGAADVKYNQMLRDDAKDLKQDLFNFNLGNIKALPNTLNAITSMTQANKYFPYIERYCCTDRELQMIREKITFNGMSVGAIGQEYKYENNLFSRTTLENNTHNFFQAQLIKIDLQGEDNHLANAIADELAKGIYVQVGGY